MATLSQDPPTAGLPPGFMQFYDNCPPPLDDADYTITVTHAVTDQPSIDQTFTATQPFSVLGPRFTLDAGDVYSFYPPNGAQSDFTQYLASIVLSQRTLPWQRTMVPPAGVTSSFPAPWLALMVFAEGEILADGPNPPTPTYGQTMPVSQVITPGGNILRPQITLQQFDDPTQMCVAIDILPATFTAVAPQFGELAYLAHCRQVDTASKATPGVDEDSWYAIVVANRFPKAGTKNIAHLVSLEGFGNYLPGSPESPAGYTAVRLVSLASWTFFCQNPAGDFAVLAENLTVGTLQLPVVSDATAPEQVVAGALAQGYVPLDYRTRQGESTTAWYRGPFLPVPTLPFTQSQYTSAEEAMIYDSATGMFDLSYAAAWQIGRLLALADRSFAIAMLDWRQSGIAQLELLRARLKLRDRYGSVLHLPGSADGLVEHNLMRSSVLRWCATALGRKIVPEGPATRPLLGPGRDPTGLRAHLARVPGVLTDAEVVETLEQGADPNFVLMNVLKARSGGRP